MTKKHSKVLGKGLRALLDENEVVPLSSREEGKLNINDIIPNENQPRKSLEGIEKLSISIKEHGVLQPIVVLEQAGNKYQIIAGERRWRAAQKAGLKSIPVIIKQSINSKDKLILGLVENLQREDLNPIDEAEAYQELIKKFNVSVNKLSEAFGKDRTTITNTIRLLNLPPQIRKDLKEGLIQAGHARPLINLKDSKLISIIRNKIINEGLSVREIETLIKKAKVNDKPDLKKKVKKNAFLNSIEDQLQKLFATKVKINGTNNKGRIVVEYYNQDDLERLLEILNIN